MNLLAVYLRLYGECLRKSVRGVAKNPWALLLPAVFVWVSGVLGGWLSRLQLIGGFLMVFVMAGLCSSYLYFVGEIVADSHVSLSELQTSLRSYIWSVMNLMFVLWIADLLLGPLISASGKSDVLGLLYSLTLFILLNPAPEIIYQRGTYGGLATIQRSLRFIQDQWIEWFLPNLPFFFLWYTAPWLPLMLYSHTESTSVARAVPVLTALLQGACIHLVMLFRGHLFAALDGSTHRQRMFKYRNAL